ncbi:hypothetical protein SAMN04489747_0914 [Auraticoccus monumenti]|uniref:Uncharacterized protein n=1 Tax=Auraticoccus monumenti TaxID=675864 RepID=A0A1G6ULP1_9ACTN|nr:hypothetical protein SAMN04489747_0914 [Auraticoccus monumenti]
MTGQPKCGMPRAMAAASVALAAVWLTGLGLLAITLRCARQAEEDQRAR